MAAARWRIVAAAIAGALVLLAVCGTAVAADRAITSAPAAADPYHPDSVAPLVWISKAPKSMLRTSKRRKRVRFAFKSDDRAATFTCRIDNGRFHPCRPPVTVYFKARRGKGMRHTFLVRAADAAGNSSGTAVRSFRVTKRKPSRGGRGKHGRGAGDGVQNTSSR